MSEQAVNARLDSIQGNIKELHEFLEPGEVDHLQFLFDDMKRELGKPCEFIVEPKKPRQSFRQRLGMALVNFRIRLLVKALRRATEQGDASDIGEIMGRLQVLEKRKWGW